MVRLNFSRAVIIFSIIALLLAGSAPSSFGSGGQVSQQLMPGFRETGMLPNSALVTAVIAVPLRNTNLMQSLAVRISDPKSQYYHRFLTDEQIQNLFLPVDEFNSILSYVQSVGLRILLTASDSVIVVQGTAGEMKEYLGITEKIFSNGTSSFYFGSGTPKIDGAFLYSSNATSLFVKPDIAVQSSLGAHIFGNVTFAGGGFSMKLLRYAYNTTGLLNEGYDGKGYTVGILDFYGSPTIQGDLRTFDEKFGVEPPPSFKIVPIGPYNPNLGVMTGWDVEIALDVEAVNAMAPGANIVLYAANGALPLFVPIAYIVSHSDNISVLSQSFGIYEWYYSQLSSKFFVANQYLVDQYYLLASLKGITFIASSGDSGGSGGANEPLGGMSYPATSPFVTAAGGTTTYISNGTDGLSIKQTAWSSPPFVFNASGGSAGGVSVIEPRPWYQDGLSAPPGYPNGRLVPDLALQAGLFPGSYIVSGGQVEIVGGTSESSPLLAGLLTILMQYRHSRFGLLNPLLYSLGSNISRRAFTEIDFGYTIPWTASKGYNLVTGWGSPNIGEMSRINITKEKKLSIDVRLLNSSLKPQDWFLPGQTIEIVANISNGVGRVSSGSFNAEIITLDGVVQTVPLSFFNGFWSGQYTVGNASGITYVIVSGSSDGLNGSGFAETFAGYYATFSLPVATLPWWAVSGIPVRVNVSDLGGEPVHPSSIALSVYSYSIADNAYNRITALTLRSSGSSYEAVLSGIADGPAVLITKGAYGYDPIVVGADLHVARILPNVFSEPGVASPGQSLFIVVVPIAPINVALTQSQETGSLVFYDVLFGSNVTAELMSPNGTVVSTVRLVTAPCYEKGTVCANTPLPNGYLKIPVNATRGLYTVVLRSSFESQTLGGVISGLFYDQIYVAGSSLKSNVTVVPSKPFMGQSIQVNARITYPNGTDVVNGLFNAVIYPSSLENSRSSVNFKLWQANRVVALHYNPSSGLWTGSVALPSPYNTSFLVAISPQTLQLSGQYNVLVTGLSYDGYPVSVPSTTLNGFFVSPYTYMSGETIANIDAVSGFAFQDMTFRLGNALFINDYFVGNNRISGKHITVMSSIINGTLYTNNTTLSVVGSYAKSVVAVNCSLTLINSRVENITLVGSTLTLRDSSYGRINPALPTVVFAHTGSLANITGSVSMTVEAVGTDVKNVTLYLDGNKLLSSTNKTMSFQIDTQKLPDGQHSLTAVVVQNDGVSTSSSLTFYTSNQRSILINTSSLKAQVQNLERYIIISFVVGIVGAFVALVALLGSKRRETRVPTGNNLS